MSSNADTFALNIAKFVKDESIDGVEIDWEYPGVSAFPLQLSRPQRQFSEGDCCHYFTQLFVSSRRTLTTVLILSTLGTSAVGTLYSP